MVKTKMLKEKIKESGKTIVFLATCLGLSREGLYNKINGVTEFKASEIVKLSTELNLTDDEKEKIFFN